MESVRYNIVIIVTKEKDHHNLFSQFPCIHCTTYSAFYVRNAGMVLASFCTLYFVDYMNTDSLLDRWGMESTINYFCFMPVVVITLFP